MIDKVGGCREKAPNPCPTYVPSIKPDQRKAFPFLSYPPLLTTMGGFVPGTETRPTAPPFPYRNQPYKAVYVTYLICKFMLSLPFWAISSIPRGWRQSPNWSWARSMGMKVVRMTDSVTYQ